MTFAKIPLDVPLSTDKEYFIAFRKTPLKVKGLLLYWVLDDGRAGEQLAISFDWIEKERWNSRGKTVMFQFFDPTDRPQEMIKLLFLPRIYNGDTGRLF